MFSTTLSVRRLANFFAAIAFFSFAISGFADPAADETDVRIQAVMAAQDEVTPSLIQRPEILGTAVGVSETGNPTLMVYVNRDAANLEPAIRTLPREVRGTPVQVELMDEPRAVGRTISRTATAAAVLSGRSYGSAPPSMF
jgi:hypothetical protein